MARIACIFLSLSLITGAAGAQNSENPQLQPTLKPAELRSLNTKAQKWIATEQKWDDEPGAAQRKARDKAKDRFMVEFNKKNKDDEVLKNVGNLLAIFDQVFVYKKNPTYGEVKVYKDPPHHLLAPKGYRPNQDYASVLVLPSWNEAKSSWTDSKDYIEGGWKHSSILDETFVIVPTLLKGGDYSKPLAEDSEKGRTDEEARIGSVFSALGAVIRGFQLDRTRMFLDCGDGTVGFGTRLLTYFPSRFAGAILRAPCDLEKLAIGSLTGMPILLVSTPSTKANCEKIKAALDALEPGKVTIVAGEGAAPYANTFAAVDTWMKATTRRLYPREITIVPTHDRFQKSFWLEIRACEALETVADKDRPRIKVKADRETNRIIIDSHSVREVGIYLNDYLVDLDKEVTFVINGKEIKGTKFQRRISTVIRYLKPSFDQTVLYTVYERQQIPQVEAK